MQQFHQLVLNDIKDKKHKAKYLKALFVVEQKGLL